jgi:hypothetical protein
LKETKIFFTGLKEICENTFTFTFNLYDSDYEFKAGQFAHFTIMDPVHHDEGGNSRPLSIANSPDHVNSLMVAARRNQSVFVENLLALSPGGEVHIGEQLEVVEGRRVAAARQLIVKSNQQVDFAPIVTLSSDGPATYPTLATTERGLLAVWPTGGETSVIRARTIGVP